MSALVACARRPGVPSMRRFAFRPRGASRYRVQSVTCILHHWYRLRSLRASLFVNSAPVSRAARPDHSPALGAYSPSSEVVVLARKGVSSPACPPRWRWRQ
eukprot:3945235-Pleurochrysis_carterae.AAC.1